MPDFEGRLEVMYGARTLQTVILSGAVLADPAGAPRASKSRFASTHPSAPAQRGWIRLSHRAATIFVDTPSGQPAHITAVAENRVALRSLEGIDKTIRLIRAQLEQIAEDPDSFKDLAGAAMAELLCFLASHGRLLYNAIVETYLAGFPLADDLPIQLVSARESFLPIEFIYDRPAPLEDAVLCPGRLAEALAEGKCTTCTGPRRCGGREIRLPARFLGHAAGYRASHGQAGGRRRARRRRLRGRNGPRRRSQARSTC